MVYIRPTAVWPPVCCTCGAARSTGMTQMMVDKGQGAGVDRLLPAWQGVPWARQDAFDRAFRRGLRLRSDSWPGPRWKVEAQRARQCGLMGFVGPREGTGLPCRRREMMQQ